MEVNAMTDQEIKETFDNIHIPPALLGKVEDAMNTQKNKKSKKIIKAAAAAVAASTICLLASNGICYAATGHSLLGKVTMYVNGRKVEFKDVDVNIEKGEPTSYYTFTVDDDNNGYNLTIGSDSEDNYITEIESDAKIVITQDENKQHTDSSSQAESLNFKVKKEGERVYLLSEDGKKKIDITDQFTGQKAEGDFNWKDMTYHYKVTRKSEEYSLSVDAKKK